MLNGDDIERELIDFLDEYDMSFTDLANGNYTMPSPVQPNQGSAPVTDS